MTRGRSLSSIASSLLDVRTADPLLAHRAYCLHSAVSASSTRVLHALSCTGCSTALPQVPLVCKHLTNPLRPQPFTRCLHNCTTLLLFCCHKGCRRQPVAIERPPRGDAASVAKQQARFQLQPAASAAAAAIAAVRAAAATICPAAAVCSAAHCCPHPAVQQQRIIDQRNTADVQTGILLRWTLRNPMHHPVPAKQLQACPCAPHQLAATE